MHKKAHTIPPAPLPSDSLKIKYLALGDSYTKGQSIPLAESFPYQLKDSLQKKAALNVTVRVIAQTGWTTTNLLDAIQSANLQEKYDLVTLLIGVNNQYQGKPISLYQKEFPALMQKAIELAGGDTSKVLILSIPDYAYTPYGNGATHISQGIDTYNNMNKMFALQYGIKYIDITAISRQGLANPSLVAGDGLHPSGKMYHLWVQSMYAEVENILK
jgi:lysophospholipase L1-like esterase